MEDRKQVMQRQPVDARASSVALPLEREAWSTPVLIGLNAAAGTEGTDAGASELDTPVGPS